MKSINPPLNTQVFSNVKEEAQVRTLYDSPYLRAILTDKKISETAKIISVANSSLAAALRYISDRR